MKTAMQILLDELNEYEKQMFEDGNTREVYCTQRFIGRATELLEKEKEQIAKAHEAGFNYSHYTFLHPDIEPKILGVLSTEDYYSKTYTNQTINK